MSDETSYGARIGHLVFAALSWLGLASTTNLLCAQANKPGSDAPGTEPQVTGTPASSEAITALLARLDACFQRGDVAGYLAMFEPDHPGAHAMLQRHLERLLPARQGLARTSTLVGQPRIVGPRTVARIHHEVRVTNPGAKGFTSYAEDTMLVMRTDGGNVPVPTCSIEIPLHAECVPNELFRCPPCNYEIGGVSGWLCVPMRSDRAQALEAASFWLIGTDLACDVSVQIDPLSTPSLEVAQQLGATLSKLDPSARPGLPAKWLPPAYTKDPPPGLCGARLEIDLPQDFAGYGGSAVFHVVTFAGLQHLLLVRGSKKSLQAHGDALQALLASYRLLEVGEDMAKASTRSVAHHTGGSFRGSVYDNELYGVELAGPEGWKAQHRPGGTAFRAVWKSPDGSCLWITGYAVPPGMNRWCQGTADRWVQELCDGKSLVPSAAGPDWTECRELGGKVRSVVCKPRSPEKPGAPRERQMRLLLCDNLLVVSDGQAANDTDATSLQRALSSLKRK